MTTLLPILFNILLAVLCSRYAEQRGRRPHVWFWIGILFGLIGLLALFLLPRYARPDPVSLPEVLPVPSEPEHPDPRFQHWFFVDQSEVQQGPVPFRRLFTAWRDQLISHDSLVWTEGMPQWEPIGKLPVLLDKLN